jgi:acetyl-CoA acetyltransferase
MGRWKAETAVAGIGQTEFSKNSGRSETQLAGEAILTALADAGLGTGDIDGLVSFTVDPVEETELARSLGIPSVRFSSRVPYGGSGSMGVLSHAAAAVTAGMADVVVVYRALNARSGSRFGRPREVVQPANQHAGTTATQWGRPYGQMTPAAWMGLNATRYMHTYGVTSEDFGRWVVQSRAYAATNPVAHFYQRPITLEDHQQSRWVIRPAVRLFDCCQETDGAVAMVVTSLERARDLITPPVIIHAAAMAAAFESEVATDHYSPDLTVMESVRQAGDVLFERGGISRSDLDLAMIYDAFTPMAFLNMESMRLCGPGEAKDFVASGATGPKGALPCNTNGGLIGEAYLHGMNLTTEAVRQLRGTAVNQLDTTPTFALASSGHSSVLLRRDV